ncbi:MAG: hypothetical protein LUC98_11285 [Lachnospiraceae bacterium]|nr:hypothetical protein [Lachnospiraceae bacterium]
MDWKKILMKLCGLPLKQIGAGVMAVVLATGSMGISSYSMSDYDYDSEETMVAQVVETETPTETVEEIVEVEEEEEEETVVQLYLTTTSIEKDLKIKIVNADSKVVTGEEFTVKVKEDKSGAKATEYTDEDKDGIIYIDDLEEGDYAVELEEIEGYEIVEGSITAAVKGQIEYKKVDVTDEIKTESEVNVAVEDTAVNSVEEEGSLTDTIELLESTVTTSKVARSEVDTSLITKASTGSDKSSSTLQKTTTEQVLVEDDTDTTDTTEENTEGTNETEETKETDETEETEEITESEDVDTDTNTNTEGSEGSGETETLTSSSGRFVAVTYQDVTYTYKATVSIPASATLYNCDVSASNSIKLTLTSDDPYGIIKSISWNSQDTTVCTVSETSGSSTTVTMKSTGVANVRAKVTYYTDGNGSTTSVDLLCKVLVDELSDSETVLKDTSGNTLYVDSNATTTAKVKDYMKYTTFYTSPQYTGWQTQDGKVYYYDANHNKVTGSQVIGGVTYTFASDGSLSQSSGNRGIDVSKYQGSIDWSAVAASGISFAIIRAGYRGSSTGVLVEDPYFRTNIKGATAAGIKVGVYFFTQAITEAEAVEEASMVLSLVSGYKITYPIFIDTESATNGRANGLGVSERTAIVSAFCKTIKNGGYTAGVYASKSWFNSKLNASSLSSYCIWVAQYNSSCTYSGKYNLWQYSSKGSVSGISGNVDMNISYLGY